MAVLKARCVVYSVNQLSNLRNKFYDLLKIKFSLNLDHLEEEVIDVLGDLKKPITFSETEIKTVISALHKIIVEAVNIENLKDF